MIRLATNPKKDISDIKHMTEDGKVKQVLRVMYVLPDQRPRVVWEWMTGFIFTKNGLALYTKSGSVIKCKNQ